MTLSSRGPGHRPFTAVTRVRIPLGSCCLSEPKSDINSDFFIAVNLAAIYVRMNVMSRATFVSNLRAALKAIREQADDALRQLEAAEEERSMRWKCKECDYVKHFTRSVPLEAAGRCPRCKNTEFRSVP